MQSVQNTMKKVKIILKITDFFKKEKFELIRNIELKLLGNDIYIYFKNKFWTSHQI